MSYYTQGCQMARFDPFLSLDCARLVGGRGRNSRKGRGQILQHSVAEAYSFKPEEPNAYELNIWLLPSGNHGLECHKYSTVPNGYSDTMRNWKSVTVRNKLLCHYQPVTNIEYFVFLRGLGGLSSCQKNWLVLVVVTLSDNYRAA